MITKFKKFSVLTLVFIMFGTLALKAQALDALGTYTPYSLFGIGDIERGGTALNNGMAGIGVGIRDNRFINYINPAAITERDTLSFMIDFGMNQKNFYNSDGKVKSAYNTFNMNNIVFTAPIYKKSALVVGIKPYSSIGYKFQATEMDNALVAECGDIKYQNYGDGGINKFFLGAAVNLFKNFSVGAEFIYYFGALNRNNNIMFTTDPTLRNVITGWDYSVGAISSKVGIQYFTKVLKDIDLTVGATYDLNASLKGHLKEFAYVGTSVVDTLVNNSIDNAKIDLPSKLAVGVSFKKKDKWLIGFDYSRQDWANTNWKEISGSGVYTPTNSSSFAVGAEFIPNKYDVRYYMKRVTYRAGLYYDKSYIKVNGNQVNSAGITFGMSLPVNRWYNAINLAVDLGQRGSLKNMNVRERYAQFSINFSLHDMWFRKYKYD